MTETEEEQPTFGLIDFIVLAGLGAGALYYFVFRGQCYKTFYDCKLRISVISESVCYWQAFPA
jgi:hypothetical protein